VRVPRFFVSYRREDAAADAGRLADQLRERFGHDHVFIDVESIDPGVDFPTVIDKAVAQSDLVLVVIGKTWAAAADQKGERRLSNPKDFVRIEIATALKRKIRVVPVLVCGATMPGPSDLPDELVELARCNAVPIREESFRRDVDAFADRVGGKRRPVAWLLALAAAAAALIAVVVWKLTPSQAPDPSDFKLKLAVQVSKDFGPVDTAPVMKLIHRAPRDMGTSLLDAGTQVGTGQYEYEAHIYMPVRGDDYFGNLHRLVEGNASLAQPPWLNVCFVRGAQSLKREPIVRLRCEEGGVCRVARDDLGWAQDAQDCPPKRSSSSAMSWPPMAFAQALPARPETGWVVPSLETLKKQEAAGRNPAFTEFILTSGPLAALNKAERVIYAIRANGTPIYIDGMPPETNVVPFQAASGIRLRFGLENLDFSGIHDGYEDIEVTLQFASGKQLIRTAALRLHYIALRPMPENAVDGEGDLGIRWQAQYHRGRSDDVYQIFLLSTQNGAGAVDTKRRIDASKLNLDGDTLVGVVRPPLDRVPWYGVALGISLPSGQVKFAFDDAKSKRLCRALVLASAKSPLIHGTAFRRAIDNVNLSQACKTF
jgi:hypothetical protein